MGTVIADDRGRVKIAEPGERYDVRTDSQGRIILRKLQPEPRELEDVPVVKAKRGADGLLVLHFPKGVNRPTREQIARAVREERDNR